MEDISLRPRKFVWNALVSENSRKQIAWGIALGVLVGFVPKGNLIAIGLAAILFTARVNLLAAIITAVICSFVGILLDPFFDHMGRSILETASFQQFFARVYQMPYAPWTAFNNTVVMGSLFVGLLQLYPTYRIARRFTRSGKNAWESIEESVDDAARAVLGTNPT